MSFLTDYKRVAGMGSAKTGTQHFIHQRLTAIALIPLTICFLYTFIGALGAGHEQVVATYSRPVPALIAIGFIWAMFTHLRMGVQTVLEDYVTDHRRHMRLQIVNALVWRGAEITGIFAVLKLAFMG